MEEYDVETAGTGSSSKNYGASMAQHLKISILEGFRLL